MTMIPHLPNRAQGGLESLPFQTRADASLAFVAAVARALRMEDFKGCRIGYGASEPVTDSQRSFSVPA